MTSSYAADAATEALIAQLMAEDFGEAYADHTRPIGSNYRDYEEPLTSYERQCIEHPDMEDGEGGWNPPTPKIEPVETPVLPEGESWDASINDDPRIESTPALISSRFSDTEDDSSEGGVEIDQCPSHVQDTIDNHSEMELPLRQTHHLQDSVNYHSASPTQSPSRHASLPPEEPIHLVRDGRRVISDPPCLETTAETASPMPNVAQQLSLPVLELVGLMEDDRGISSIPSHDEQTTDTPQQDPTRLNSSDPSQLHLPEPSPSSHTPAPPTLPSSTLSEQSRISPSLLMTPLLKTSPPKDAKASQLNPLSEPFVPNIATNERLLKLMDRLVRLRSEKNSLLTPPNGIKFDMRSFGGFDSEIDTSSAKNKGKAPVADIADAELRERYKAFLDELEHSSAENESNTRLQGADRLEQRIKALAGLRKRLRSGSREELGLDIDSEDSVDKESSLPLLHIPWPDSGRTDRDFREAMEAQVHEIWVGEFETVDSILLNIREREEISKRPWGTWGDEDDAGGGDTVKGKGKERAVECF